MKTSYFRISLLKFVAVMVVVFLAPYASFGANGQPKSVLMQQLQECHRAYLTCGDDQVTCENNMIDCIGKLKEFCQNKHEECFGPMAVKTREAIRKINAKKQAAGKGNSDAKTISAISDKRAMKGGFWAVVGALLAVCIVMNVAASMGDKKS